MMKVHFLELKNINTKKPPNYKLFMGEMTKILEAPSEHFFYEFYSEKDLIFYKLTPENYETFFADPSLDSVNVYLDETDLFSYTGAPSNLTNNQNKNPNEGEQVINIEGDSNNLPIIESQKEQNKDDDAITLPVNIPINKVPENKVSNDNNIISSEIPSTNQENNISNDNQQMIEEDLDKQVRQSLIMLVRNNRRMKEAEDLRLSQIIQRQKENSDLKEKETNENEIIVEEEKENETKEIKQKEEKENKEKEIKEKEAKEKTIEKERLEFEEKQKEIRESIVEKEKQLKLQQEEFENKKTININDNNYMGCTTKIVNINNNNINDINNIPNKGNIDNSEANNFEDKIKKIINEKFDSLKEEIIKEAPNTFTEMVQSSIIQIDRNNKQMEDELDESYADRSFCFEVHQGVKCSECGICPIVGFRYKCCICDNINYCSKCEERVKKEHKHPMYKLRFQIN